MDGHLQGWGLHTPAIASQPWLRVGSRAPRVPQPCPGAGASPAAGGAWSWQPGQRAPWTWGNCSSLCVRSIFSGPEQRLLPAGAATASWEPWAGLWWHQACSWCAPCSWQRFTAAGWAPIFASRLFLAMSTRRAEPRGGRGGDGTKGLSAGLRPGCDGTPCPGPGTVTSPGHPYISRAGPTAASADAMGSAAAMSDGGLLLSALALLLATVAVWWATGPRAPRRRQAGTRKLRQRPGAQARGPRRSRAAPVAPRASRPRPTPRERPDGPASPPSVPCSCGPCVSVAKELQELMLLLWAPRGTPAPLYAGMWRALWARLEQLGKRGHLPCCASSRCSGRLRPRKRLLPPRMAIPGRASSPPSTFRRRPTIPPRSSGCQRSAIIPGASSASDGPQPCKDLPASDRLPPSEKLPVAETPRPSEILPTACVPAQIRQPSKILPLQRPFVLRKFLPPSQSIAPGSLEASQKLRKPCRPADTEEALDSSPCSLGDQQQHPVEIHTTGASQSIDTARESRQAETGAQLQPDKHSQEQVAEPQASCSHQCPPQGSQDAAAEPAGSSPAPAAETAPRRPWRFTGLQEAAPRRPPRPSQVFRCTESPSGVSVQ